MIWGYLCPPHCTVSPSCRPPPISPLTRARPLLVHLWQRFQGSGGGWEEARPAGRYMGRYIAPAMPWAPGSCWQPLRTGSGVSGKGVPGRERPPSCPVTAGQACPRARRWCHREVCMYSRMVAPAPRGGDRKHGAQTADAWCRRGRRRAAGAGHSWAPERRRQEVGGGGWRRGPQLFGRGQDRPQHLALCRLQLGARGVLHERPGGRTQEQC